MKKNFKLRAISFGGKYDFKVIRQIVISSQPIFYAALLVVPAQWWVKYVIFTKENGSLALSVFGIANQWVVLIQFFPLQIAKVILPFLTKQNGSTYRETEKTGLAICTFIGILLIVLCLLFDRYIIRMYGFDYDVSIYPFRIMIVFSFFSIMNIYYGQTVIAGRQAWIRTIVDGIISVSLILSFVVCVNQSIMLALPVAYSVAICIGCCCLIVLKKRFNSRKVG